MILNPFWIVAIVLAIESVWIARTFDSLPVVLGSTLLVTAAVVIRARSMSQFLLVSREAEFTASRVLAVSVIVIGLCAAMIAERLSHHLGESISVVLAASDTISHVAWLLSAVLFIVWPRGGHPMMVPLAVSLSFASVFAGGVRHTALAQSVAIFLFCSFFALISQTTGAAQRCSSLRFNQLKTWLSLAVVMLMIIAASLLSRTTQHLLPDVQASLARHLRESLDSITVDAALGGSHYVDGSRFGSVGQLIQLDPSGVALKVYASTPPGYLRGSVFDVFDGSRGRWLTIEMAGYANIVPKFKREAQSEIEHRLALAEDATVFSVDSSFDSFEQASRLVQPVGNGTAPVLGSRTTTLRRFELQPENQSKLVATVEVHNDPMKGRLIFTPLASSWIEAASHSLVVSKHDCVLGGINVTEPYVAGVNSRPPRFELREPLRLALLHCPESIVPLADAIVQSQTNPTMNPRTKASRISSFFQSKFAYSLVIPKRPDDVLPLNHFLNTRHAAHCEYFATSTALVLRRAGVPTRYVTGYVVDKASSEGEYWVAHNADAHAWVEAYDDQTKEWFAVESTPGRQYLTLDPNNTLTLANGSGIGTTLDNKQEGRSLWQRIIGVWSRIQSSETFLNVVVYSQFPIAVLILIVIYARHYRLARTQEDPVDIESRRRLRRMDRILKRFGLVRRPSETLHQFALRVESTLDREIKGRDPEVLASWYRDYAAARYQGQLPNLPLA